jgi:hypothetical protein
MNNLEDEVNHLTTSWQCKRKWNVPSSAVGGITSKCAWLLVLEANVLSQCLLLKSMQLTFKAWVVPLTLMTAVGVQHTDAVKNMSLSLHDLRFTGRRLFGISFVTSLKPNLCTALSIQNTAENDFYFTRTKHDCTLAKWMFDWIS